MNIEKYLFIEIPLFKIYYSINLSTNNPVMKHFFFLFILSTILCVEPNKNTSNNKNITIGSQIWQGKNLEVSTYNDGTPIPQVTDNNKWRDLKTGAWRYYKNDSNIGEKYGKLYNWYALAEIYDKKSFLNPKLRKELAPKGWKIPSKKDYEILINFLGGEKVAGGKLKEKGTLNWTAPNTGATDTFGFSALPSGGMTRDGALFQKGYVVNFWCSTDESVENAYFYALEFKRLDFPFYNHNKGDAFAVRCILN